MSTQENQIAVPQQDEILVQCRDEFVEISQPDTSGNGLDSCIVVHRDNLTKLILVLRKIDGQEA